MNIVEQRGLDQIPPSSFSPGKIPNHSQVIFGGSSLEPLRKENNQCGALSQPVIGCIEGSMEPITCHDTVPKEEGGNNFRLWQTRLSSPPLDVIIVMSMGILQYWAYITILKIEQFPLSIFQQNDIIKYSVILLHILKLFFNILL